MTEPVLDRDDALALARSMRAVLRATELALAMSGSTLQDMITEHIGCPISEIPNVRERWEGWEHANLQRGVDAYLAAHSPDATWFGIGGGMRMHQDLMDMLSMAAEGNGMFKLGAADYVSIAIGPDRSMDAVRFGLTRTVAPDGTPVVVAVRGSTEHEPICTVQVLAADRATATAVRERISALMREHDVFQGQILAFGISEFRGNELVTFLPRPELTAAEVVLPHGVLDTVERHVVLPAGRAAALLAAGQHLKRGLLLHGPPGTGKTHTVRYLLSRLTGSTVVIMSGRSLSRINAATTLARRLQPSVVVVEDVDLIAQDRSFSPDGTSNPLLFELLNQMEGVGSDADVTFMLTTNRVETLEHALTDRPGRVDLAIEVPRPDADGRERLLRLYTRDVPLDLPDPGPLVAATEGVTASFIRELARRAVLLALDRDPDAPVRLDETVLRTALDDLLAERNALTRNILGGTTQPEPPAGPLPYPPNLAVPAFRPLR